MYKEMNFFQAVQYIATYFTVSLYLKSLSSLRTDLNTYVLSPNFKTKSIAYHKILI
jgi:archaellum biogenesis ATPase FlaH